MSAFIPSVTSSLNGISVRCTQSSNMMRWFNFADMLSQRRRRWPNIAAKLAQCVNVHRYILDVRTTVVIIIISWSLSYRRTLYSGRLALKHNRQSMVHAGFLSIANGWSLKNSSTWIAWPSFFSVIQMVLNEVHRHQYIWWLSKFTDSNISQTVKYHSQLAIKTKTREFLYDVIR